MGSQVTLLRFGELFDQALDQYVIHAVSVLIAWLAPIAVSLVTLWILIFGYATVRGETGDPVPVFVGRALRMAMIVSVALTQGLYLDWVVGGANSLLNSLAGLFAQAAGLAGQPGSVWALVDRYDSQVESVVVLLGKDVLQLQPPFVNFPNLFAIILVSLGGCFFEVCLLAVTCFAKIVLTLALALGPAFILTLLFAATSRFFDAWLSKLLSAVMLSGVSFFLAGLSLSITGGFLASFVAELSTVNFIVAGMVVGVVELLLGVVMLQAPTLAAALTGGAIYQSGIGTVSALLARRGGRNPAPRSAPVAGEGSMGSSGGAPASASAQGTAALTRALRKAAYKMAAIRGRH